MLPPSNQPDDPDIARPPLAIPKESSHTPTAHHLPLVGITTDLDDHANGLRIFSYRNYARAILAAGGVPVFVPPEPDAIESYISRCDAFVLAGGDDPTTEPYGVPTSPKASPIVHPQRQSFEHALLVALASQAPDLPVLGVCLGMQMMALVAGGRLEQDMQKTCPTYAQHWKAYHEVRPVDHPPQQNQPRNLTPIPTGSVRSKHHQAVADPGHMRPIANAPDSVIEAIDDPSRRFYLGVQWHPERTRTHALGLGIYASLVRAAILPRKARS